MEVFAFIGLIILVAILGAIALGVLLILGSILFDTWLKAFFDRMQARKKKKDKDYWVY
jgi:hypothetical protein